ncbi:MATE family efflux transporter [Defluviitalea phaphyphila]|uniref:MATE family efflux transporter n=1 Tax=Defluviitalea phaphyphila TaxID=1473580 RepID=UPI000730AE5E|nr:MATE family efflux transporter [Defluviitalea phaphyphila]
MRKSILSKFLKYITLSILGMIGISFYILADTYFVANALGEYGLASLNLSIPVYSVINGMGLMVGIGGATRANILKSQNKYKKADQVFASVIKLSFIISTIFVIIGSLGSKYLALVLGADTFTLSYTKIYLTTILSFAPFYILNNVFLAFVRNDKNPKLSMIAMLLGSFFNIILDYVFMFPLQMGMFGAAFATGIAPIISIFTLLSHFKNKKKRFNILKSKLKWSFILDIFSLGLSSFIIEISSAVVLIIFNLVILGIKGNLGVAAYGIVANLALVGIAIFTGLAQGIQPIISKYYGSNEHATVMKIRKYALFTSLIISIIIYSCVILFSDSIIHIFNKNNNIEISQITEIGLKIYFLGFFFAGINIVTAMFLSAIENAKGAFLITIARGLVIIVPLVLILSKILNMIGVWLSFVVTELFVTLIAIYLIKKEKEEELQAI